uniref:PB1 domain-containing protein n=1 Tax=Leersia perrieri TaxID=77586 RepID=A0A0D9VXN6_9ORYZ
MGAAEEKIRLLCSHGGRLMPCGPNGSVRYVGGETRALVVPREVTFAELTARLAEKAGATEISSVRYRLADGGLDDDLLVSVTCDEELAHMVDEYDRLKATRPTASFRVFVSTTTARRSPPMMMMRRARSEQDLAAWNAVAAPMRRVHSAQELAGCNLISCPCFYDHRRRQSCRCCCCHRRRDHCAPVRPMPFMSKNVTGAAQPACGREAALAAKATDPVAFTVSMELDNPRACWELE